MIELLAGIVYGATATGCVCLLVEVWRLRAMLGDEQLERGKAEERARRADGLAIETIGNTRRALAQRINDLQTDLAAELRATLDHDCEEQVMQRTTVLKASAPIVKATYCLRCSALSTNEKPEPIQVGGGGGSGGKLVEVTSLQVTLPKPGEVTMFRGDDQGPVVMDFEELLPVANLRYETCGKHGCSREGRHVIQGSMTYYACDDHFDEISALVESEG